MAIYGRDGTELISAYSAGGLELDEAYASDGTLAFVRDRALKVMTYNVGSWYDGGHDIVPAEKDEQYYALQRAIIRQNNPDIMFMNEYTKRFSKMGRTSLSLLQEFFPYIHEQGGDSDTVTSGRCIASKFPISNYTVRPFNDGSGYYYDSCTVTIKNVAYNLVITHLHWDNRTLRTSEMSTIMSLVSGYERFILAGDFNTSDCFDTSGADYIAVVKPLVDAGYHVSNCGDFGFIETYFQEPTGTWHGVLDNTVTSSNMTTIDVYADETKLNDELTDKIDHLPLVTTIEL